MTIKTNAQAGYEAYGQSTGGKTWDGKPMPTWEEICERTPHVKAAWETAAANIIKNNEERAKIGDRAVED